MTEIVRVPDRIGTMRSIGHVVRELVGNISAAEDKLRAAFGVVDEAAAGAGGTIAAVLSEMTDAELVRFSEAAGERSPPTNGMHRFLHDLIYDEFERRRGAA